MQGGEYEVEAIVGHRIMTGKLHFNIKVCLGTLDFALQSHRSASVEGLAAQRKHVGAQRKPEHRSGQ